jgi:hypothetical protein
MTRRTNDAFKRLPRVKSKPIPMPPGWEDGNALTQHVMQEIALIAKEKGEAAAAQASQMVVVSVVGNLCYIAGFEAAMRALHKTYDWGEYAIAIQAKSDNRRAFAKVEAALQRIGGYGRAGASSWSSFRSRPERPPGVAQAA